MKKLIKSVLTLFGYRISKIRSNEAGVSSVRSMKDALESLVKDHKININTVVDVGAAIGTWSSKAMEYYSPAQYLLIEAQTVHEVALKKFVTEHANSQYVLAAAGDREGQIFFLEDDPYSGQASFTPYATNNIVVPVTSIDIEIKRRKLPGPYLLKLDTHGFEVPILTGATHTLSQTEIIIMECYNFKIGADCLLFYDMCTYLNKLGFRCIDLVEPLWRLHDNSLWQMDLVFIKNDRPEFSYLSYH